MRLCFVWIQLKFLLILIFQRFLKQFAKQVTRDSDTVDKDLIKNGNASS